MLVWPGRVVPSEDSMAMASSISSNFRTRRLREMDLFLLVKPRVCHAQRAIALRTVRGIRMGESHKLPDVKAFDEAMILEYMDSTTDPVIGVAIF